MALTDVNHEEFTYVFVPANIDDPIEERKFAGKEEIFQTTLKSHFMRERLLQKEEEKFRKDLSEKADGKLTDQQLNALIGAENNYQIIPLTLPSKVNDFKGTNAYIDSIGRVKELPVNARASRICSTDIRGDCFLSTTFDDEEDFRRIDFTKDDYDKLLKNPPDARSRWNETAAFGQLLASHKLKQQQSSSAPSTDGALSSAVSESPSGKCCHNCGVRENLQSNPSSNEGKLTLKRCGGCGKTFYCSAECQKADWKYHKHACKKS